MSNHDEGTVSPSKPELGGVVENHEPASREEPATFMFNGQRISSLEEAEVKITELSSSFEKAVAKLKEVTSTSAVQTMSASVVASSEVDWRSWTESIALRNPEDNLSSHPELATVCEELKSIRKSVKYPRVLQNMTSHDILGYKKTFTDAIRDWAQTIQDERFEPKDRNDESFSELLRTLAHAWHLIEKSTETGENEISTRRGSDLLIELAFEIRMEGQHDVLFEQEVVLPLPREAIAFRVPTATADTIIVKKLSSEWEILLQEKVIRLKKSKERHRFHWTCKTIGPITVPTFVVESKHREQMPALNQLAMYFAGLQHQRRAICLPNKFVYGATVVEGELTLFASKWVNVPGADEGDTQPTTFTPGFKWNLTRPSEFIECFLFLCSLSDRIHLDFEEDMRNMDKASVGQAVETNLGLPSWRPLELTSHKRKMLDDDSDDEMIDTESEG